MLNIQVLRKSSLHEDKSAYTYSIVPFECLQIDTHTFYSLSSCIFTGAYYNKKASKSFFSCQVSVLMPCLGDIGFLQSRILRYFSSDIFFSQIFGSHNLATPYQKQQSYIHNI